MDKLPFTKQTSTVALAFFALYFLYGLFYLPFTQYLVSLAVGGIVFGVTEKYELATIALFLMNFLFPVLGGPTGVPKVQYQGKEGFMATNPAEISQRVSQMKAKGFLTGVEGVGSPMTEGFEDASQNVMTLSEPKKQETTNSADTTATSKPAPTETATPAQPAPTQQAPTPAPTAISQQGVPPANQPATAGFQDNGGLFKLGQIPSDTKGGNHIDTSTTVMNALSALKPDQIKSMTQDTKQLIETQKALMGMLQSFQPMMAEGKQMMQTFSSMFAPTAGAS